MTILNHDTGELIEPLTAMEHSALTHAEATIERGLQSFIEVGEALSKVRDERLYRTEFGTFEAYCRDRWGITDRRARQMIDASEIVDALPTGTIVPVSESQARALSGLAPDEAAETMRKAHEATNGKLTAAAITNSRGQQRPATYDKTPAPPEEGEATGGAGQTSDEVGGQEPVEATGTAQPRQAADPTPSPASRSEPDEYDEQDRAEELAAGLAAHLSMLYALTDDERRAEYIALWHLGTDHRPVLGQKYVHPRTMRRIADALQIFATEWEHANV